MGTLRFAHPTFLPYVLRSILKPLYWGFFVGKRKSPPAPLFQRGESAFRGGFLVSLLNH